MKPNPKFRIIFVDDETIVREGIATRIPWGENDFDLVGVFADGQAVLDYMETNPVDVVLSDISMPRMDGLRLSAEIAARFPRTQVLLLTGFEEFEYAQEAVRHRVKEFLLKPITAKELGAVLERTKIEMNRIRHREQEQKRLREVLDSSLPLLRERFYNRLVSGRIGREEMERRREFIGWHDRKGMYQILIAAHPDDWDELTRMALAESANSSIREGDAAFGNRNEDLVILLQGDEENRLEERAKKVANRLFTTSLELGDSPVTIGMGEIVNNLDHLHQSCIGAGSAVDHAKVVGLSQVQSIGDVRRKSRASQEAFSSLARRLVAALRDGSGRTVKIALDDVFRLFEESCLTSSEATGFLARLRYLLWDFIDEMGLSDRDEFRNLSVVPEFRHFPRLDEARRFFSEQISLIEAYVRRRRHDAVHSRIDRAKTIISRRYGEKAFALQDICAELYLSKSQFSALFKEGTGRTFVEYLTGVRMDKARRLLKTTDMKSYEIADRVGYQDPRYFSSLFKKTTGLTTSEYRRSLEE